MCLQASRKSKVAKLGKIKCEFLTRLGFWDPRSLKRLFLGCIVTVAAGQGQECQCTTLEKCAPSRECASFIYTIIPFHAQAPKIESFHSSTEAKLYTASMLIGCCQFKFNNGTLSTLSKPAYLQIKAQVGKEGAQAFFYPRSIAHWSWCAASTAASATSIPPVVDCCSAHKAALCGAPTTIAAPTSFQDCSRCSGNLFHATK
eukprot:1156361-Pelagomonas_calceolata.AAC.8